MLFRSTLFPYTTLFRSLAPGSEFPERYFLRRRIALAAIALLLAVPGLWALLA